MNGERILRGAAASFVIFLCCVPLLCQSRQAVSRESKPCALAGVSAERVREAQDAADMLPAPLRADALIRIATKVSSACPALAKNLLQRAFEQAGSVQPETSYKQASGMLTDSRISYAAHAYELQADRLSLESRAVLALAAVDPRSAIRLFQSIAPPQPVAAECASALIPDVSIYYKALERIFPLLRPSTPLSDAAGQKSYLIVEDVVRSTTSPVQLAPLAEFLEKARLRDTEFASLIAVLAAGIEQFPPDERSFRNADSPTASIARLVRLSRKYGVSPYALVRSYRDYMERSKTGVHCGDYFRRQPKDSVGGSPKYFDDLAKPFGIEPVSPAINGIRLEPDPDEGEYWHSAKTKDLLQDAKHLNFDDQWVRFTDAEKKTPQWRDRVERLLNHMEEWHVDDESNPTDYYHQRCMLIRRTLAYLQPGPLYDRVVGVWMSTLEESPLQFDNVGEWYYEVSQFLSSSKRQKNGSIAPEVLTALKQSSNGSLHASGVLAEFLQ